SPGAALLDRMVALVEGAQRQKTPNEIALSILLAGLTIIFHAGVRKSLSVRPLWRYFAFVAGPGRAAGMPDSDHHRRAALGHRHRRDGSPGAAQCARDVGPRGPGPGPRGHAAPRPDPHHH